MIPFDNTEVAFKGKSKSDLKRAYWLFRLVSRPGMVKLGKWFTQFALSLRLPINKIIRKTIFRQFCGGVSVEDSLKTSNKLAENNVKTILDYSIEGKTEEEDFDKTVKEIIGTIKEARKNLNIPFAVFKVTGICLFETLKMANESEENLNEEFKPKYKRLVERVDSICKEAYDNSVPLFIDAEETWIQNSIDRIVHEMIVKYNQERAIIHTTYQFYRHDRLEYLKQEIQKAREEKWHLGVKFVRGAYMEKERERAVEMGYDSPIQPDKESCDRDYNEALKIAIENIDVVSVCNGTHNEESSAYLVELMAKHGIAPNDPRVYFAQLFGMSDHISFNLAQNDYMVAKYVPYGPIKEVLPYLIRRAEENTSIAGQTGRELSLIIKEINRRKKDD